MKVLRVHQVWATDITYVPMSDGYMYLIAIIDLYSRYVLVWSISNTMDAEWCSRVLRDALEKYPAPEIFNTDQGSQFTSEEFTGTLLDASIRISMDGKGRALDNIFRGRPCGRAIVANSQIREHLPASVCRRLAIRVGFGNIF